MAEFTRFYITEAGIQLQARVLAGETLNFTRAAIGDGRPSGDWTQDMGLLHYLRDIEIHAVKVSGANQATIEVGVTNDGVVEGYFVTEIGLYAYDPTIGEILYGIVRADVYPLWVPPYQTTPTEEIFDFIIAVSADANITINDDKSRIYVSWAEFEERIKNHRHPATHVDESTGETTEEAQRRQDAMLASVGQAAGVTQVERHFGNTIAIARWSIGAGVLSGVKLTTGGVA